MSLKSAKCDSSGIKIAIFFRKKLHISNTEGIIFFFKKNHPAAGPPDPRL